MYKNNKKTMFHFSLNIESTCVYNVMQYSDGESSPNSIVEKRGSEGNKNSETVLLIIDKHIPSVCIYLQGYTPVHVITIV